MADPLPWWAIAGINFLNQPGQEIGYQAYNSIDPEVSRDRFVRYEDYKRYSKGREHTRREFAKASQTGWNQLPSWNQSMEYLFPTKTYKSLRFQGKTHKRASRMLDDLRPMKTYDPLRYPLRMTQFPDLHPITRKDLKYGRSKTYTKNGSKKTHSKKSYETRPHGKRSYRSLWRA